jgi:hypothetical protein
MRGEGLRGRGGGKGSGDAVVILDARCWEVPMLLGSVVGIAGVLEY